jgi:hypothetical protein
VDDYPLTQGLQARVKAAGVAGRARHDLRRTAVRNLAGVISGIRKGAGEKTRPLSR